MENNAQSILKKQEEENRRSAMAKRMAQEEQRRRDMNVQQWNGILSHRSYLFSVGNGSRKWASKSKGSKVLFVLGIAVVIIVIAILVFTAIKAFSSSPILYK